MTTAISARAVSKRYERPSAGARKTEVFWALRHLTFDVQIGEVLGVIGKNGAGKSTLLKILSRITSPTKGEITLTGRVGSLLEVGTGFHPELSGRENVFLNGAILGMSRSEVKRKFDEIVDFAGIAEFIDMPVKRYSSGMYMRLAFAVAAHLEPDILIVDEVLAVGDSDFQKKCLGKMQDVAGDGRTVLFVSHNMNAVRQLCQKILWLDKGEVRDHSSNVDAVINRYLFGNEASRIKGYWAPPQDERLTNPYFELIGFGIVDEFGDIVSAPISNDKKVFVEIRIDIKQHHPALNFGYVIYDEKGQCIYWSVTTDMSMEEWPDTNIGKRRLSSEFPRRLLNEGRYRLELFASLHAQGYLSEPGNTEYSVNLLISGGLSDSPYWREMRNGMLAPNIAWSSEAI